MPSRTEAPGTTPAGSTQRWQDQQRCLRLIALATASGLDRCKPPDDLIAALQGDRYDRFWPRTVPGSCRSARPGHSATWREPRNCLR